MGHSKEKISADTSGQDHPLLTVEVCAGEECPLSELCRSLDHFWPLPCEEKTRTIFPVGNLSSSPWADKKNPQLDRIPGHFIKPNGGKGYAYTFRLGQPPLKNLSSFSPSPGADSNLKNSPPGEHFQGTIRQLMSKISSSPKNSSSSSGEVSE